MASANNVQLTAATVQAHTPYDCCDYKKLLLCWVLKIRGWAIFGDRAHCQVKTHAGFADS